MIPEHELRQMYCDEQMSQPEIAAEIRVTKQTVCDWMKKYEIKARTHSETKLMDIQKPSKERLQKIYCEQGMSQPEIASEIGVNVGTVRDWMKKYEIKARTQSEVMINGNFTGENSKNWHGGISGGNYCYKFNNTFKEAVRERDDYTCQLCGYEQKLGGRKLSVHHIHYDKADCYPDVVTLCHSCNIKVNSNRDYWEEYFENELITRGLFCWSISQEI